MCDVRPDAGNGALSMGRPHQPCRRGRQSEERTVYLLRLRLGGPEPREDRASDPPAHERLHGLGEGRAEEARAAEPRPAQRGAQQDAR